MASSSCEQRLLVVDTYWQTRPMVGHVLPVFLLFPFEANFWNPPGILCSIPARRSTVAPCSVGIAVDRRGLHRNFPEGCQSA